MAGKLVIGNWKMNGRRVASETLVAAMLADPRINRPNVGMAPPAPYLALLAGWLEGSHVAVCAQDASRFAKDGAFTGDVSAAMLADIGCQYVLVGHSERRQYHGESNEVLRAKLANVLEAGLVPVLCVGETLTEREEGRHRDVIRHQLSVLEGVDPRRCVVAYEPVWAIGTGKVASLEQIAQMHADIKSWCLQIQKTDVTIRTLYGGSVKADNAEAILSIDDVDGALVGGASLEVESFAMICMAADKLV
ncbi:triosephosphate isomerase [Paludibacterium paludis]|uniref:Triosephosphate isomerase n=2 Tax=Paludibacterium paludis TaxID=1225769 RepID=A0A918P1Y3_9NEIS|nr:triosephosphate isomerase [Paludibacterium paludis]